ncbi:uncharacterized protein PHACADRAFT_266194 [Phanerochaete carnosa HHB-10118-sp]|uniref:Uncharacterized protein n=1 Tax=Phanerochaete carnosa (strain HHB-10118-sp) TaxID=650164 RepID=K5UIJ2_PHACS|nr:uncharacterized protein PHACADRAFT_265692 [Phanerochaete carnosa HHB-10118-sp]XP_007402731.1 uncharacterized protein PHACADRAFT_266194 [Phanerochaete carnosa HHB-10118-sp]EKM48718.1 hypothetical protein PHACADRAFT_266194 [Phanerochaete carnosa HHB-10118-sp]EKM49311.1 hypothetical protein PHACADRAFT_265692 [Phanerochaete carnosa HHB-10118-sp]
MVLASLLVGAPHTTPMTTESNTAGRANKRQSLVLGDPSYLKVNSNGLPRGVVSRSRWCHFGLGGDRSSIGFVVC